MRDEVELGRRRARLDACVALARHTLQLLRRHVGSSPEMWETLKCAA
jgi:hypothetical protein